MAIIFKSPWRRPQAGANSALVSDEAIAALVGYERRARSLKWEIFDPNVLNESSWPLLHDLFAAHLEGAQVRTKELCATSGLPQTTVLRYLDHLERFGAIRRDNDPDDQRVTLVSITEDGAFWMRRYYSTLLQNETRLASACNGLFGIGAKTGDP